MAARFARGIATTVFCSVIGFSTILPPALAQSPVPPVSAEVSYEQTVKPIFDRSCSGCHVNGGHAGGLKLDSFALLMKGGEDGVVMVPGDPTKSMLAKAIHYDDTSLQMPPKAKLADDDIAVIDRWIKESSTSIEPSPATPAKTPAVTPVPSQPATSLVSTSPAGPASPQLVAEQEQFFETSVRPILVGKCYSCHASAAKGGLRLDSRKALLQGGKDGAVVVPGHPETSMLSSAVHYGDSRLQMPPRLMLKPEQVASLDQWIKDGLIWPESASTSATEKVTEAQRNFWSFRPPVRPAVPVVQSKWAENDIDRFILANLEEKKLKVGADADKRTLIRRVTYDLTGLPPTAAEVEAFTADKSPQAYEHIVDRLLASKSYGERWGRIWLDVVRYADTTGGGGDFPVPQVSKYRDYVIEAFNEDKPYDRFIKEQIAGDLLPAATEEAHWKSTIATGYLAGASTNDNAQIPDAVDNLGYAFLGVTVACARCHDHKFDPIPTSDYYALAGILKSTHFPKAGDDGVRYQKEFVYRDPSALQRPDIEAFQAQLKPIEGAISAVLELPGTYDDLLPQLERRRMNLYARAPVFPETAYAVSEGKPLQAQIQLHGDPTNLGDEVPRGFLQVLGGSSLPPDSKGSGRLELANWIASKDNPLTARVLVNRLWQGHFGRGIVATPNNFGNRGLPPSNQALLDFLATELIQKGWSIKAMQREMVLSHAYRLSTADIAANDEIDPDNLYLWRHTRMRLDAEEIRDSLLADSQLLDRSPAGLHPFPPQSEWNWEEQNPFVPELAKYENDHRTVYMMVQRSVKHPYMTLFDGADANASTDQRSSSLTPLQALYFMNSAFPKRCADHLAELLDDGKLTDETRLDRAFLLIYNRLPEKAERARSMQFIQQMSETYVARGDAPDIAHQKSLSHLFQVMFSSNEFMFIE
ncbi:PSD1 and planctomycete cytochrome C domain-containing protein [Granulicella sp. S156]|uniref:PSD1 and planctomycete cytochrome C domain-containing protein n=1 Tax=Granulicella sp. S156 TaxID=1747224 RepID=UPI00131E9B16|nr:PSD1 and planctomycete cytochrome C domain-containing protein [Granulicella sp. S156]